MLEVIVVLVVFGLVALLLGMSRWLAARPWAAAGNLGVALVLLISAQQLWPAARDLQTYERLPPRKHRLRSIPARVGLHFRHAGSRWPKLSTCWR